MDIFLREDLYLSKEPDLIIPGDVIVQLAKHQIDGLRFLYRQFIKKKPGVILNDPSGYGKKAQVTIFLNAVKTAVIQPILVLCNEIEITRWKCHFKQWCDDDNDIIFESNKPYTNKKIFVNTFDSIDTFSQRNWSIVVVDDPVSLKLFKPLQKLRALFRVWIVSIDLKAHLNTFAAINDWVNPNSLFCREQFVAGKSNLRDVIEKAVLLDAYFEDIVLRRGTSKIGESQPEPIFSPVANVLRKNKDSTGTKVKRSKKRILNEDLQLGDNSEANIEYVKKEHKAKISKRRIIEDDEEFEDLNAINNDEVLKSPEKVKTEIVYTTISERLKDEDENKVNVSRNNLVNTEIVQSNEPIEDSQDFILNYEFSNSSSAIPLHEDLDANEKEDKTENVSDIIDDTIPNNEINNFNGKISEEIVNRINVISTDSKNYELNVIDHNNEHSSKANKIEQQFDYYKENPNTSNASMENNVIEDLHTDIKSRKTFENEVSKSLEHIKTYFDNDETADTEFDKSKMTETILSSVFFNNYKKDKVNNKPEEILKEKDIIIEETGKTSVLNDSCNNTINSSNETSFDDKLKELQDSANKKFKGSFLDNLF